ncbi:MAG: spondin domain-containing protein [Chromatiales bacterium]
MKIATQLMASAVSAVLLGFVTAHAAAPPEARYQVTFERTWSGETHPKDFPLLAHFSPVIGVTHDARYSPIHAGGTATPGLERLCEEGKHQPLDAEIRSAIKAGTAGMLIETSDPIRDVPGQAVASFEIDPAHPMVSIAAMIAPSPDWCAVAADVELFEGGQWLAKKTVMLYAWDAGTDSATSYRAFDKDMEPRGPVQLNDGPYFVRAGKHVPVGQVTFVRQ